MPRCPAIGSDMSLSTVETERCVADCRHCGLPLAIVPERMEGLVPFGRRKRVMRWYVAVVPAHDVPEDTDPRLWAH